MKASTVVVFLNFSVTITCTKEGVRFSCSGDLGTGNISLKQNASIDKEEEQVSFALFFSSGYFVQFV